MEIVDSFVWPGADAGDVKALEEVLGGRAPELLAFYRNSDGLELCLEAEGVLNGLDEIIFDDCGSVVESLSDHAESFPGALVFGGDGGSMLLALDVRKPG